MPNLPRSLNYSVLSILTALSVVPLFQNCSAQIEFGKTENFALEQGLAELVDVSIDPNSWASKPKINVVAIVDNSDSMAPIPETVAAGLENSLDALEGFSGRLELYTTTQGDDPRMSGKPAEQLQKSVVEQDIPLPETPSEDPFVTTRFNLSDSFTSDGQGNRGPIYYQPQSFPIASVKRFFGESIRSLGTRGSSQEQGLCSLMRSVASQSQEEQTQTAYVLVTNEDDETDLNHCLEKIQETRLTDTQVVERDLNCSRDTLDREGCSTRSSIRLRAEKDRTHLTATYAIDQQLLAASSEELERDKIDLTIAYKEEGYFEDTRTCDYGFQRQEKKIMARLNYQQARHRWTKIENIKRVSLSVKREASYNYEGRIIRQWFTRDGGIREGLSCREVTETCTNSQAQLFGSGPVDMLVDGLVVQGSLTNSCRVECQDIDPVSRNTASADQNGRCEQFFRDGQLIAGKQLSSTTACSDSASCRFECNAISSHSKFHEVDTGLLGFCNQNPSLPSLASVTCPDGQNCSQFCAKEDISCSNAMICRNADIGLPVITRKSPSYRAEACAASSDTIRSEFLSSHAAEVNSCGKTHNCSFVTTNRKGSPQQKITTAANKVGVCSPEDLQAIALPGTCINCRPFCNARPSQVVEIIPTEFSECSEPRSSTRISDWQSFVTRWAPTKTVANNGQNSLITDLDARAVSAFRSCSTRSTARVLAANGSISEKSLGAIITDKFQSVACSPGHGELIGRIQSWYQQQPTPGRSPQVICYQKNQPERRTLVNAIIRDQWDNQALGNTNTVTDPGCQIANSLQPLAFPTGAYDTRCQLRKDSLSATQNCGPLIGSEILSGSSQQDLQGLAQQICGEIPTDFRTTSNINFRADRILFDQLSSQVQGRYRISEEEQQRRVQIDRIPLLSSRDPINVKNQIQGRLGSLETSNFAAFITPSRNTPSFADCEIEARKYNPEDPDYNPFQPGELYARLMESIGTARAATYSVCANDYRPAFEEIVQRIIDSADYSYRIQLAEYENVYKVFLVDQQGKERELQPYMYFVSQGLLKIEPAYYNLIDESLQSIRVQIYRNLVAKKELEATRSPASNP